MAKNKTFLSLVFFTVLLLSCKGQTTSTDPGNRSNASKTVGGGCEGCELMYVGMPAKVDAVDTSSGWFEKGQKLLITGTVFKIDGKTPASGVIIYYWQTDNTGYYAPNDLTDAKARRHGHVRGWVRTDTSGRYAIYTIRPAPYPNENIPAHIHTAIKEPDIDQEYYIDEFIFDDDKLVTSAYRSALENRGGSGVLRVLKSGDLQVAEHNIILGLNIPNHPAVINASIQSGLPIGQDSPSFIPYHAAGPDKGTRTCPVCKYGRFHGIIYFVGNKPEWSDIKRWLAFLEKESTTRNKYLKAYFVYGNENNYHEAARRKELVDVASELHLQHVALTFVPSFTDKESDVYLNKINPEVKNTFVIYKHSNIIDKFVNLEARDENFKMISSTLDKTRGAYFNLPAPIYD